MNPLFTVLIQLPPSLLPSPLPQPPPPSPIGSATPPSGAPHPGNYCAVGIATIEAATCLQSPFLFRSPSRVAARPTTINVVVIIVLQVFWICPHHLDRSPFEFSHFFLSPPWILPRLPMPLLLLPPPLLSLYLITILITSMFICQLINWMAQIMILGLPILGYGLRV